LEHIEIGSPNADLVVYISASDKFCTLAELVFGVACNFDQLDRPIAGSINLCLDNIDLSGDILTLNEMVNILIDTQIRIMGLSSNHFPFFRDETGNPRTPRPFTPTTVECVDGMSRTLILPDQNTLQFSNYSGGQRSAFLAKAKVKQVTRNHFDCQGILGALLGNQPFDINSCTGEYWDKRFLFNYPSGG
jgi:hypothetical protein